METETTAWSEFPTRVKTTGEQILRLEDRYKFKRSEL